MLDYNGCAGEWKSIANAVLDEAFEREMKLPYFVRKDDKCRRIDLYLGDVTNLNVSRQPPSQQHFLSEKLVQFLGWHPHKP